MNLLGIDAGTTGCKVALFSPRGEMIASTYREYDARHPQPGYAELDAVEIWARVQDAIREVTAGARGAPIKALSISSLGEAVVPVSADRRILGSSILNFDARGEVYLAGLGNALDDETLYQINGNTLGNHFSLTKLMWIKEHKPELYSSTYKFLHWSAFLAFMLGAEPRLDYSLANRSLLFDLESGDWSDDLLSWTGLERGKLPSTIPPGSLIGSVAPHIAENLGLSGDVSIVAGAHDQCANAVGCGVIDPGSAVYGMGTYLCITPVFSARRPPETMIERGINTEHHAVPGRYVCFIYNQGGSLVKWFRDNFAAQEHRLAQAQGSNIYPQLFAEMPGEPSSVLVLPHFSTTGPPSFISDSSGVIAGLRLETSRGDILKGVIEGATYYLMEVIGDLPPTGIQIEEFRAVGGGSQSDVWVQTCADIFGQPFTRPATTEAGVLGAAIIAGVGSGVFPSYQAGVEAMVKLERVFEPDPLQHERYQARYQQYRRLWPLMSDYLRGLAV